MPIESQDEKFLPGSDKPKPTWLWLEGLRCFRRNFWAWSKWASFVSVLEIAVLIPIFGYGSIVDKEWLGYVAALIPIPIFFAFFIQQEPLIGMAKVSWKSSSLMLKNVLRIFLNELPVWVGAILAMYSPQISEYFGRPLHFSKDDLNTCSIILVMSGLILFKGIFCYSMFHVFQTLVLIAHNVARPMETARLFNQGNLGWVSRNFCVLYFADLFLDSIGQVFSIYWFLYLAQWLQVMGVGSAMEIAGVVSVIIVMFYYTAIMGIFAAFASATNRILYQKIMRDDPTFRLVLNEDAPSSS